MGRRLRQVKKARALEMEYVEQMGVYERVPRAHQWATGGKIVSTKWLDVKKGDSVSRDYRSQLVGREF